jgi:hypothetical protein
VTLEETFSNTALPVFVTRYVHNGEIAHEVDVYFLVRDCAADSGIVIDKSAAVGWLLSSGGTPYFVEAPGFGGSRSSVRRATTGLCENFPSYIPTSDGMLVRRFAHRFPDVPSPASRPAPLSLRRVFQ